MTGIGTTSFISFNKSASATTLCNNLNPYNSTSDICSSSSLAGDGFECGDGDLVLKLSLLLSETLSSYGMSISTIVGVWSVVEAWCSADNVERQDLLLEQTRTGETLAMSRMCVGIMIRTFAKCFSQNSYTLPKVRGFGIGSAMVCDAVNQVGSVNGKILASIPIDIYHIYPDSVHSDGCKDRDQSRDWCAFAANGMGLDQTVPARRAEPRAASRRNLATDNRAQ